MQHPDEGTIHSWLDGALPAAEAAGVEAHVATCQSCAAAVAEARGFIAASSRILTALDDVPRGVVPAAPERRRDNLRVVWRAAAAMLIVAGGSVVVMREGGPDASKAVRVERPAENLPSSAPVPAPQATDARGSVLQEPAVPQLPAAATGARVNSATVERQRIPSPSAPRRRVVDGASGAAASIGAVADAAAPPVAPQSAANFAAEETKVSTLKLVGVERRPGTRRMTYEVSPMVTVVLTESESLQLSAVVVTGAQTTGTREIRLRGNTASPSSRAEATAPAAPPPPPALESRTRADSSMIRRDAAAAKAPSEGVVTGVATATPNTTTSSPNTITWTEAGTGKTLSLSGNLSVERLQEIRVRIEKERAAAKTP